MKGIGPIAIAAIAMVVLVSAVGIYSTHLIEKTQTIRRVARESIIIEAINQLELFKRSLKDALVYSFYQASYETLKHGGNLRGIPYWRKFNDFSEFPNYLSNLSKRTLRIFDEYVDNLTISQVSLPTTKEILIENLETNDRLSVWSEEPIKFSGEFFSIFEILNISSVTDTRVLEIFEIGKEKFVNEDSIGNAVREASNSMSNVDGENYKKIELGRRCTIPNADSILNQTYPDADNVFEERIRNGISQLETPFNSIEVHVSMIELEAYHEGSCVGDLDGEDESCGCKEWVGCCKDICSSYEEEQPCRDAGCEWVGSCQNPISCSSLNEDECTGTCKWVEKCTCIEYNKIYENVTCSYEYYANTTVLVNITDSSKKYPVYDEEEGTTNFRNFVLNFLINSGKLP